MATKEVNDFEDTIKVIKFALKLFGIDTSSKSRSRISTFFFCHFLFFVEVIWIQSQMIVQVLIIVKGIRNGESIMFVAMVLAPCVIGDNMISFKAICVYWNRNILTDILNKFKLSHPKFDKSADSQIEKAIVLQSQNKLKLIVTLLLSSSVGLFLLTMCLPIAFMVIKYLNSGEILLQYIPVTPRTYSKTYPMILFFWYQVIATFFICVNIFTNETTYYALCTFLTMHFKLLCCKFKSIKYAENDNYHYLRSLIRRHHDLIDMCNDMEKIYSKANLTHIMLSSLMICLCGITIVFSDNVELVAIYIIFLISILTQVFFLCYFGDMIICSSIEVGEVVYESLWYNADQRTKKTLLIILIRAQTPCKLTAAGFGDVNIITFSKILSRSWSYFALLQTLFD